MNAFTTDKFEQKVNASADEQQRTARNIKFNWAAASGTTRYEFWDYMNELEREIERVLRPTRFNY